MSYSRVVNTRQIVPGVIRKEAIACDKIIHNHDEDCEEELKLKNLQSRSKYALELY